MYWLVVSLVITPSIKQELYKRGSAALAYLSHQAIVDINTVFSRDATLTRTVQAVNIAVQASNMVQRANADLPNAKVQWHDSCLRDWVLILEYGSHATNAEHTETDAGDTTSDPIKQHYVKQHYWAALMATSVLTMFTSRCHPQHVDILHALNNTEVLALEFLHTRSLGRTYIDHRTVTALSKTTSGVSPKALCEHVLMPAEACKDMLRHLYTLNLIKGVSDGTSVSMRQLYLTDVGFELMSRLHFGVVKLA